MKTTQYTPEEISAVRSLTANARELEEARAKSMTHEICEWTEAQWAEAHRNGWVSDDSGDDLNA